MTIWCSDTFCKLRNYENVEYEPGKDKGASCIDYGCIGSQTHR